MMPFRSTASILAPLAPGAPGAAKVERRKKLRAAETKAKQMRTTSARSDRAGVLGKDGAWKRASAQSALLRHRDGQSHLPPFCAALALEPQRMPRSQMCGCLEEVQWATCVVCWRAW